MNTDLSTQRRGGAVVQESDTKLGIDLAHGGVVAAFEFAGHQYFVFGKTVDRTA